MKAKTRCAWAGSEPQMIAYHDDEWGVPLHDDNALFELLILEGAQAGLSWRTILNKRLGYREAFDGFDPARVARFDRDRIERLVADPGIVRNRLKIESAVDNAKAVVAVQSQFGSLDRFLWDMVGGRPTLNRWTATDQLPASSPQSDAMSKTLKSHGFRFVGTTICYAFMQATGMVNDHLVTCFRHAKPATRSTVASRMGT
jgi:DNA-3-methyladenine glycosylase I